MEGMEKVIASVSGYHGSERFKLIKLISLSGASYVGSMNRSTTHLICWKFEGNKYELAKKLGTTIANHQWLEACIKEGKRVPESPYISRSGNQVGTINLEVPDVAQEIGVLREDNTVLNILHRGSTEPIIDLEEEDIENWDDELLLKKDREPSKRSCKLSRKEKKSIPDCYIGTTPTVPTRKSRRLVKKTAVRSYMESIHDSEIKSFTQKSSSKFEYRASTSKCSNLGDANGVRMHIQSDGISTGDIEDESLLRTEEIIGINDVIVPRSSEFQKESDVYTLERTMQKTCSDKEKNVQKETEISDQVEHPIELPTSSKIACIICHTEHSSTRGVLSCGHRFCLTCIQSWADHMASSRKATTCPLCKSLFTTITKVDETDCGDQKIYSQTIPCPSSTQDIIILPDGQQNYHSMQISFEPSCCQCNLREPEDLLISCQLCQIRCIHSYCLDPVLFPWICTGCKEMRMFHYRI